jgi:hypothetical protein
MQIAVTLGSGKHRIDSTRKLYLSDRGSLE